MLQQYDPQRRPPLLVDAALGTTRRWEDLLVKVKDRVGLRARGAAMDRERRRSAFDAHVKELVQFLHRAVARGRRGTAPTCRAAVAFEPERSQ